MPIMFGEAHNAGLGECAPLERDQHILRATR